MPTGYTAGIIDGEIKDFQQFAKTCMRAFGATIHMRDESLDAEYFPAEPSEHHLKARNRAEKDLMRYEEMSPNDFIESEKKLLRESLMRYKGSMIKSQKNRKALDSIRSQVESWIPPTKDHENFKKFMIDQIDETIKFDADIEYYEKEINNIEYKLAGVFNGEELKDSRIEETKRSISYHLEEYGKEVKRVSDRNKWVEELIESINK